MITLKFTMRKIPHFMFTCSMSVTLQSASTVRSSFCPQQILGSVIDKVTL